MYKSRAEYDTNDIEIKKKKWNAQTQVYISFMWKKVENTLEKYIKFVEKKTLHDTFIFYNSTFNQTNVKISLKEKLF